MAEAEAALDAEVAGLLHAATLPDTVGGFDGLVDEALARPERSTPAPGPHGLRRDGLGEGFDELALRSDGLGELFDGLDAGADSTGQEGGGEADDLDDLPDLDQGLGEYLAEMGELPGAGSTDASQDGPDDMLRRLGKLADRAREAAGGYNAAARAMNDMVHSPHYGFVARVFGYRPVALYHLPEARGRPRRARPARVNSDPRRAAGGDTKRRASMARDLESYATVWSKRPCWRRRRPFSARAWPLSAR